MVDCCTILSQSILYYISLIGKSNAPILKPIEHICACNPRCFQVWHETEMTLWGIGHPELKREAFQFLHFRRLDKQSFALWDRLLYIQGMIWNKVGYLELIFFIVAVWYQYWLTVESWVEVMYNLVIATKLSAHRIFTKVNMIPKRNFKMSSIYMYIHVYYWRFTLQFRPTVVWWIAQFPYLSCQTTRRSDSIWPVLSRMDCSNTSILHSLQACVSCYGPNVDKNHALAAVEGRKRVGWAWNNIHMHVNIPNLISTRISVIAITVSWFSSLDFWWISDGPFS